MSTTTPISSSSLSAWNARAFAQTGPMRKRILMTGIRFFLMAMLFLVLASTAATAINFFTTIGDSYRSTSRPVFFTHVIFGVVLPLAAGVIGFLPALRNIWNVPFFCTLALTVFTIITTIVTYASFFGDGISNGGLARSIVASITLEVFVCAVMMTLFWLIIRNNPRPYFHTWWWVLAALPLITWKVLAFHVTAIAEFDRSITGNGGTLNALMFALLGLAIAVLVAIVDHRVAIAIAVYVGVDALWGLGSLLSQFSVESLRVTLLSLFVVAGSIAVSWMITVSTAKRYSQLAE